MLTPWQETYNQPRQHIKKQRHYFVNRGPSSQGYGISSGHVWMWELDCKEGWVLKNWCFWTVVLEKSWDSLGLQGEPTKSILKEISPGCSLEGLMLKLPTFWPSEAKSWLIGKDPDVGKDWRQEKGMIEGWDGWKASPTQWTWVWSWWWTGRPGLLRFMGLQRVRHDWVTELNWTNRLVISVILPIKFIIYMEIWWYERFWDLLQNSREKTKRYLALML